MNEKELWSALSEKLKTIVDAHSYSIWISPIQPIEVTPDKLVLSVDNDFMETWIKENYLTLMSQVLSAAFPDQKRQIVLQVSPAADPLPPPEPPRPVKSRATQQKRTESRCIGTLNENFTIVR